jgi:aryl-alcohol dehydrogenase (NADP+)
MAMKYANLGSTGMRVSRICLGCMTYGSSSWRDWVLDYPASLPFIESALAEGINFFDTADVYSLGESERVLGRALRELGAAREKLVIATKVFNPMGSDVNDRGLSRKHIMKSIDASLSRLGMDYVDLYQVHRFDTRTPIEETMEALNDVVRAGKALYIGASSMYAWQFAKMQQVAKERGFARFVSMQNHYNLVYREEEREMNPLCLDQGVGLIPWSPLARGFLAGNRPRGAVQPGENAGTTRARSDDFAHRLYYQDADFDVVDAVGEVARARGVNHAQVALAWLLAQPGVSAPIVGASKPQHLADAIAALPIQLTPAECKALEAPYRPHPVLGHG